MATQEQAVIVHLDAVNLSNQIYQECDLATIEDQLAEIIGREQIGEYDGNEYSESDVTLYMYGPDADKIFSCIELTLRNYPLCKNARVEIRYGGPEARCREVCL